MSKLLKGFAVVVAVIALAVVAVPAADAAYTRDLSIGSTGSDVAELQSFLVAKGHLVMPAGVAYGYFGSLTRAALAQYQGTNGIYPPYGYFGPLTRAHVSAAGFVTPPNSTAPAGTPSRQLGPGEASLESFDLDAEEDEIAEGDSEVVATAEFDVEDGDVEIQRVDVSFTFEGNNANADDEPWDVFEEVVLLADGKKIASIDASDEDEWLDDDEPFVLRFSNLKYVVREGDSAQIEIEIEAQKNVDGSEDGDAEWEIYIDDEDIRAIDGERLTQYTGDDSATVAFEVVGEGDGDDLELKTADDDDEIDEGTIVLDERDRTEAPIFAFVLSTEDSDNDVEINQIEIDVEISSTTGAIGDLVRDFILEVDGDEFDAESYNDSGDSVTLTFDIDGDVVVDADDEILVALIADFRAMDEASLYQGVTIVASTTPSYIDAEGADDITVDGSSVVGEEQTLRTNGVVAEYVSEDFDAEVPSEDQDGTIKLVFDLTAIGEDFDLADDGSDITYVLDGATTTDTGVTVKSETASGGDFEITDGETDRVTFTVKFATTTGLVQLEITDILGFSVQDLITDQY